MDTKEQIEKKFLEMTEKAKLLYPDLEHSLTVMANVVSQTENLQNLFNLVNSVPEGATSNHIPIQ